MAILVSPERTLELVKKVYLAQPYNPEYLSEFNQAFYKTLERPTGLSPADLAVTQCPYSEDQIRTFMILGRKLRKSEIRDFAPYAPLVLSSADRLVLLAKVWPEMGDDWLFQIKEGVSNVCDLSGWMRTEQVINAPYTYTNEKEAKEIIELKRRIGQTINIYVLASQQSKELTGRYFDENSRTRILSSRRGIVLVEVSFDKKGQFSIFWPLKSLTSDDNLGVRSVLIE